MPPGGGVSKACFSLCIARSGAFFFFSVLFFSEREGGEQKGCGILVGFFSGVHERASESERERGGG